MALAEGSALWLLPTSQHLRYAAPWQTTETRACKSRSATMMFTHALRTAPSETWIMQFDLIKLSLSERIFVKLRGDRELTGVLHVSRLPHHLVPASIDRLAGIRLARQSGHERRYREHIDIRHCRSNRGRACQGEQKSSVPLPVLS